MHIMQRVPKILIVQIITFPENSLSPLIAESGMLARACATQRA